jgi:hypothetical protein
MSLISHGFHRVVLVAGILLAIGLPAGVHAQDTSTLNKVVTLNKKALQSYESLDMEAAAKFLKEAVELCNLEGLERHPAAARTHIHLGVVDVAGLRLRDQGLLEFRRAIGIDPNIKVTKSLMNPEVDAVFAEALAAGGEAPPAAAAAPLPSAPPPAATKPAAEAAPVPVAPAPVVVSASGISHPPVTEAVNGKAIEIKAQIPAGLHAEKIVLAYRNGSEGDFLAREMQPIESAPGWYHEKIPAEATQGTQVSYYIEAQDADGQALASSGTQSTPHKIQLGNESAEREDRAGAAAGTGRHASETPLWFVFAAGIGGGYFSGTPEMNPVGDDGKALKSSGTDLAKLAHLAPEIGYFQSEHLLLSLQGRLQYVTGGQDVTYNGNTYKASKVALAGLAKASYFLPEAGDHFQPFIAGQAGFGEIRYPVETIPLLGCGQNGVAATCKDTVRGGLGLFGVAAGFAYMLGENVGIYTSVSGLVGLPDLALNADLNVGVAFIK